MSATDTCRQSADASIVDGNSTSMATLYPDQLTINYDLYRAIEDLRSVPVLRWSDDLMFDDDIACDVVDRVECKAVTSNSSLSHLGNQTTTTSTTISSELPHTADLTNKTSPLPLIEQHGWVVIEHKDTGAHDQSPSVKGQTDADNERVSDEVFVDVATPIDADLLIDDVYEREMDQLDQLDTEMIAANYPRDWPDLPSESTTIDGLNQDFPHICWNSADTETDSQLFVDSSTDGQRTQSRSFATERSFPPTGSAVEVHYAEMHPQSVFTKSRTSNSLTCHSTGISCLDASAEELFEEIVESMKDTVAEDDFELDALVDAQNQLTVDVATMESAPGEIETAVGHRNFVIEKFVDDNVGSPVPSPISPTDCHSGRNVKQDTTEQKRQKDLTVCLESTLNECLDALSQIEAGDRSFDDHRRDTILVERYRKYDTKNSDIAYSPSSTKSSLTNSFGRQYVTSSSSGFQSDLMDVDIDEEFDVNIALNDADFEALKLDAQSTSLDSLLELNDDDGSYSDQTIIRRPIPPTSKYTDNHSTVNVNGFVEKPTTRPQSTVKTETSVMATDRTEDTETVKLDADDVAVKENGTVVSYDDTLPTVEVLAEELITQEIVLNIVLPCRSKKKEKRTGVDGRMDISESAEDGVVDHRKSCKSPHRDFHIHRVVRCSDAADSSGNRLSIFDRPESNRQSTVTESDTVENEDERQFDSSTARTPGGSLVSGYVGGPLSVEVERNAESSTTEEMDDDTSLRITRRNRFKVLRAPDGSGAALFNAPVASIRHVLDDVGRTLVGDHRRQPLPPGARVTCEAVERKSSTSLPDGEVTVVRRTIVDDSDSNLPMLRTAVEAK